MSKYIEFKNVKKIYKMGEVNIEALSGVNFSVDKGEFVVVAGASGAGKSTILNILGGMDSPSSGQIIVDNKYINNYSNRELITAKENVELATQICKDPLDIDEVMEAVGLGDRKNNFPAQLSGGEQQRVAIARALAKNPKLLLCDEPTGALDYNTGKSILKLLQDTCRKMNMTVIIITHNLALTPMGDKVIKVKNGKIESVVVNDNPTPVERIEW